MIASLRHRANLFAASWFVLAGWALGDSVSDAGGVLTGAVVAGSAVATLFLYDRLFDLATKTRGSSLSLGLLVGSLEVALCWYRDPEPTRVQQAIQETIDGDPS